MTDIAAPSCWWPLGLAAIGRRAGLLIPRVRSGPPLSILANAWPASVAVEVRRKSRLSTSGTRCTNWCRCVDELPDGRSAAGGPVSTPLQCRPASLTDAPQPAVIADAALCLPRSKLLNVDLTVPSSRHAKSGQGEHARVVSRRRRPELRN
jgi:hypothetical protein